MPRAGLASQADDFARIYLKGYAIHRLYDAILHEEMCSKIFHFQQRLHLFTPRSLTRLPCAWVK